MELGRPLAQWIDRPVGVLRTGFQKIKSPLLASFTARKSAPESHIAYPQNHVSFAELSLFFNLCQGYLAGNKLWDLPKSPQAPRGEFNGW